MEFWPAMEVSRRVVHHHWWSTFALVTSASSSAVGPTIAGLARSSLPRLRHHAGPRYERHTVVTELLEAGEPDHVVESLTGHLSRGRWSITLVSACRRRSAALDVLD